VDSTRNLEEIANELEAIAHIQNEGS